MAAGGRDRVARSTSTPGAGSPSAPGSTDLVGLPVAVDNDAKALALGEGWVGAARGCDDYLAMVVSTGVGGGIVLDGRLLDGPAGNAGHIGHVVVEPEGRPCVCGGRGCLEAEVSGTAIAAMTGQPGRRGRRRPCAAGLRHPGRPGGGLGGQPARPPAGRGGRFGGARVTAPTSSTPPRTRSRLRCGLDFARSTRIEPGGLGADGPLVGAAAVGRRPRRPAPGVARSQPPWGRMAADGARPSRPVTGRDAAGAGRRGGPPAGPVVDRTGRAPAHGAPPAGGGPRPTCRCPTGRLWEFRMVTAYGRPDAVPGPGRRGHVPRVVPVHGAVRGRHGPGGHG